MPDPIVTYGAITGDKKEQFQNTYTSDNSNKFKLTVGGFRSIFAIFKDRNLEDETSEIMDSNWKFHLSINPEDLDKAWDAIYPIISDNFKKFKVVDLHELENRKNEKTNQGSKQELDRFDGGMQITLYPDPSHEEDFIPLLQEIEKKLLENDVRPGKKYNTDRSIGYYTSLRHPGLEHQFVILQNDENITKPKKGEIYIKPMDSSYLYQYSVINPDGNLISGTLNIDQMEEGVTISHLLKSDYNLHELFTAYRTKIINFISKENNNIPLTYQAGVEVNNYNPNNLPDNFEDLGPKKIIDYEEKVREHLNNLKSLIEAVDKNKLLPEQNSNLEIRKKFTEKLERQVEFFSVKDMKEKLNTIEEHKNNCLNLVKKYDKKLTNDQEWKPLLKNLALLFSGVGTVAALVSIGHRLATGRYGLFDNKKTLFENQNLKKKYQKIIENDEQSQKIELSCVKGVYEPKPTDNINQVWGEALKNMHDQIDKSDDTIYKNHLIQICDNLAQIDARNPVAFLEGWSTKINNLIAINAPKISDAVEEIFRTIKNVIQSHISNIKQLNNSKNNTYDQDDNYVETNRKSF